MTNGSDTRLGKVPVPLVHGSMLDEGMEGGRGKKEMRERNHEDEHSVVRIVTFSIIKEDNVWTA